MKEQQQAIIKNMTRAELAREFKRLYELVEKWHGSLDREDFDRLFEYQMGAGRKD